VIGYKSQGPCFTKEQGKFNIRGQMDSKYPVDAGFLNIKYCVIVAVIRDMLIIM